MSRVGPKVWVALARLYFGCPFIIKLKKKNIIVQKKNYAIFFFLKSNPLILFLILFCKNKLYGKLLRYVVFFVNFLLKKIVISRDEFKNLSVLELNKQLNKFQKKAILLNRFKTVFFVKYF